MDALLSVQEAAAAGHREGDAEYYARHVGGQAPEVLWVGCADSRVQADAALGPGKVFVHRNVGNQVRPDDPNCMSAVEYSIMALGVKHVVVCGHQNCGAVKAALTGADVPENVGKWISGISEAAKAAEDKLKALPEAEAVAALCEINVRNQVAAVCGTKAVQGAWDSGKPLAVSGAVYSLETGKISEVTPRITSLKDLAEAGL
mmetsp:Transcript_11236/g.31533  ORF Transcript_11236/g.31533 Transcript_11236/m.31533 type:complete len:203 (+) Transcript_11236:53-661(+)